MFYCSVYATGLKTKGNQNQYKNRQRCSGHCLPVRMAEGEMCLQHYNANGKACVIQEIRGWARMLTKAFTATVSDQEGAGMRHAECPSQSMGIWLPA